MQCSGFISMYLLQWSVCSSWFFEFWLRFEWMVDLVVSEVKWFFDWVYHRFHIDLVMVDFKSDDWVLVIGWCRCIWWLYCSGDWFWASMLLMGLVWKFDETWPSYCIIVYQEYPMWKFMKHGPWRILRIGAFSEKVEASCQY